MTILTMPDGSAFDSRFVAAITWDKSNATGRPACLRVYGVKDSSMGFGMQQHMEQVHYIPMGSDEAAREACEALVQGWTGKAMQPATAPV